MNIFQLRQYIADKFDSLKVRILGGIFVVFELSETWGRIRLVVQNSLQLVHDVVRQFVDMV